VLGLARATLDGTTLKVDVSRPASRRARSTPSTCTASSTTGPNAPRSSPTTRTATASSKRPRARPNAYGPVIAGLTASGDAQFGLEVSPTSRWRGGRDAPLHPDLRAGPGGGRRRAILDRLTARFEGRFLEFHGLDLPGGAGAGTPAR
jgi:hypothetical protein